MKKSVLYIFFILSFLSSCNKDVKFPKIIVEPKPIVCAYLSQNDVIVSLFWSNSMFEGQNLKKIDNADVSLYKDTKLVAKIPMVLDGRYKLTGLEIEELSEYELRINIPKYGELKAKTIMPSKATIQRIYIEQGDYQLGIIREIENNLNRTNYYYVSSVQAKVFFKNGVIVDTLIKADEYPNQTNPNRKNIDEGYNYIFDDEKEANNIIIDKMALERSYFEKEEVWSDAIACDSAILISGIKRINYDYYKYLVDISSNKIQPEIGLDMESVLIHSNIENGYGIFAAYYQMKLDTLVLKLEPKTEYSSNDYDEGRRVDS